MSETRPLSVNLKSNIKSEAAQPAREPGKAAPSTAPGGHVQGATNRLPQAPATPPRVANPPLSSATRNSNWSLSIGSLSPERPAERPRPAPFNVNKARLAPTTSLLPPLAASAQAATLKPASSLAVLDTSFHSEADTADDDSLTQDYLAELGEATALSRTPSPQRRLTTDAPPHSAGSAGAPPSPWTPVTPQAFGIMNGQDAPSTPRKEIGETVTPPETPGSSRTQSRDEPASPVLSSLPDKIYTENGGPERLVELNMDSVLATMRKLGIKKQSRLDQRKTLKDFAEQLEAKVTENLKVLLPFVSQHIGDWKAIDPLPSLTPKLAEQLRTFLSGFHPDELTILYKDSLYGAINAERLDLKVSHTGSASAAWRILIRLIESIVPEVLYGDVSSDLANMDEADQGSVSVLKLVMEKAGRSDDGDQTAGGYLAWAASNQRAELGNPTGSPDRSGKQRGMLPPRTVSSFYDLFLEQLFSEVDMDAAATPMWLLLLADTATDCLAQLNSPGTRPLGYKSAGQVDYEKFDVLVRRVGELRKEIAKVGGKAATKPKNGEQVKKDPRKLLLSIYEGTKAALFPLATVEKGSTQAPFAARLLLVHDGKEAAQPKLFDIWFNVQSANQTNPFLAPEYQALLLSILSNRNEPGVYLAWTKIAADDWSGNGAWISYLDSVARQRRSARGADLGMPSEKERWNSLDKRRLRHALEGFANSAALELDDLNKRKKQGIQTAEDGNRRRQVEATTRKISSLLAAFPRPGSYLLYSVRLLSSLLWYLAIFIFGTSVLSNAFPRLMKMRLKPDAPIITDMSECRGVHGQTWCTARDKTLDAVKVSKDTLASVVEPAYKTHVEPLYEAHVKPIYDKYGAQIVLKASEYLPQIQEAVAPAAGLAGAGILRGVSFVEEVADTAVKWTMNRDWSKATAEGMETVGQTAKLVRRKTEEGWELAKPHVQTTWEKVGEAASSAYARALEVPAINQAATFLQEKVGEPAGQAWGAVSPKVRQAGSAAWDGARAAYLLAAGKKPTTEETWSDKLKKESVREDLAEKWKLLKAKAGEQSAKASGYLNRGRSSLSAKWNGFVSWLEDSVGIEFGELDNELRDVMADEQELYIERVVQAAAVPEASAETEGQAPLEQQQEQRQQEEAKPVEPTPEPAKAPAVEWEDLDDMDLGSEEPAFDEPPAPASEASTPPAAEEEEAPMPPEESKSEEQPVEEPVDPAVATEPEPAAREDLPHFDDVEVEQERVIAVDEVEAEAATQPAEPAESARASGDGGESDEAPEPLVQREQESTETDATAQTEEAATDFDEDIPVVSRVEEPVSTEEEELNVAEAESGAEEPEALEPPASEPEITENEAKEQLEVEEKEERGEEEQQGQEGQDEEQGEEDDDEDDEEPSSEPDPFAEIEDPDSSSGGPAGDKANDVPSSESNIDVESVEQAGQEQATASRVETPEAQDASAESDTEKGTSDEPVASEPVVVDDNAPVMEESSESTGEIKVEEASIGGAEPQVEEGVAEPVQQDANESETNADAHASEQAPEPQAHPQEHYEEQSSTDSPSPQAESDQHDQGHAEPDHETEPSSSSSHTMRHRASREERLNRFRHRAV